MSYKIKFDDITSVQVESQKTMNAWGEAINNLNTAMTEFINNTNLQGQAISSMRTYLVEVHGTLLQTMVNLMNDYSSNLLLYKDGYYQIDSSNHAKLPGQVFTTLHSDLKSSRDNLKGEIELLNAAKDKISDLVSYSGSSHTSTVMDYNFLMNQVKNLDSSIIQYESTHASQDLVAFKELLAATKALIAEHAGKTRTVGTYQSGDFAKLQSVQRFAIAYQQASKQMESRVERVKAAQERDKARFEALAAEDRAKKGWIDLGLGVLTAAIGVLAIVATCGSATPLVFGFGLTAGLGTFAYGTSNAGEGLHNIQLGNAGDGHTKAKNFIRDTLFMGNDKLYHQVGGLFVTASAIMIPIGQTQSVAKGLTQFAIGEAGAYTTGQVAYHGTKLLGGSEEDAQTANFIGNIIGGYAASSAASKFSLNKVKNNLSEQNFSNYREFSTRKIGNFKTNFKDVETKITVESRNAAGEIQRIQLKAVDVDKTGKIRIPDYTTAKDGLSIKHQTILDNIERNGGVIVGKGNGKFVGSVEIPKRTRIDVINSSNPKIKNFKMELEKIQRADMSRKIVDGLISTEKGQRLDPSRYLSHQEIETHLNMFKDGVVKVISKEGFNKSVMEFGGNIGPEKGHYVMPKFIYDKAVLASDGNPRVLEELLGLDRGYLGDSPLTINVKHPKNLRMPSGNEPGAWQGLWEPGGFTKGGIPEAVVDQFKPGDYTIGKIFE